MNDDALLGVVATHPLGQPTPPVLLDAPSARRLLSAARRARLEVALLRCVEDGALEVPEPLREQIQQQAFAAAMRDVRLEQALLDVVEALQGAGIDVLVLKGAALAHLAYPQPELRSFGDVDLLVRGEQLLDAVRLLERDGARRRYPSPGRRFDERVAKGAALRRRDGIEIDLHRSLAQGPVGASLRPALLFDSARRFWLGGRHVPALGADDAAVHAAVHALGGAGHPTVATLRDVLWCTMPHDDPDAAQRLVERAQQLGIGFVLGPALSATRDRFGSEVAAHLAAVLHAAAMHRPTTRQQRWLDSYTPSTRRSVALALGTVQASAGRDRMVALQGTLLPRAHNRSVLQRLRRLRAAP